MKAKSVVLLSGGLDSTVNLFEAAAATDVVLALTIDYGQRARLKEIQASKRLAAKLQIKHLVLTLPFFKEFGGSSLTDHSQNLPVGEGVQIHDLEKSQSTAKSVWVPNRNGIFLNIAAGYAEALGADLLVPGFNAEEAKTFPDNSEEFVHAVTRSLYFSTANKVLVQCYTIRLEKPEIVRRGTQLGVDFSMIWPCYQEFDRWCGECESCLRARHAFIEARVDLATLPFAKAAQA